MTSWGRLLHHPRPHRPRAVEIVLLSITVQLLAFVPPVAVEIIIDKVLVSKTTATLVVILGVSGLLLAVELFAMFISPLTEPRQPRSTISRSRPAPGRWSPSPAPPAAARAPSCASAGLRAALTRRRLDRRARPGAARSRGSPSLDRRRPPGSAHLQGHDLGHHRRRVLPAAGRHRRGGPACRLRRLHPRARPGLRHAGQRARHEPVGRPPFRVGVVRRCLIGAHGRPGGRNLHLFTLRGSWWRAPSPRSLRKP